MSVQWRWNAARASMRTHLHILREACVELLILHQHPPEGRLVHRVQWARVIDAGRYAACEEDFQESCSEVDICW